MKNKKINIGLLSSFILIELILLVLIVFIKVNHSKYFCYLSVIITFIYSLIFSILTRKYIISLGLFFTLLSDLFLVLLQTGNYQIIGMMFFVIVQLVYGYYLLINDKKHLKISLIIRISINLITLIVGFILLKQSVDLLSVITMIYFANLISNIIASFLNFKNYYLLSIGLILFILCDIHVGLTMANNIYFTYKEGSLLYKFVDTDFNFTWFFYIPSLSCIAISILDNKNKV